MLFVAALFVSCLVTLMLARYAWARRDVPTAKAVTAMMLGISWWTFFYALELLHHAVPEVVPAPDSTPLFWFRLMFIGAGTLPAAFLLFVIQYTGTKEHIRPRTVLLLSIVPTSIVLIALTDGIFHSWFLAGFSPGTSEQFTGGPAFWFHVLYSYLLAFVAYGLLVRFMIQNPAYRLQALLLLVGGLASSLANIMTILKLLPEALEGLDLSPFGFLFTTLVMFVNIRKVGFLDVMPIARSLVFEHMADGVLVTDASGRLVDRNPAARYLFETPEHQITRGQNIQGFLPDLMTNGELAREIEINGKILSVQHNKFYNDGGSLRGQVFGFRDVTELKRTEANLREQLAANEELRKALKEESIRDPLTGLFNRRWLDEVLDREIARALREQQELSLCVIDVDHFKRVNDTWGHEVGDRVLVALASLLQQESRKHDVVARFGGEEFVLVLPGLGAEKAKEVLERMNANFQTMDFGLDGLAGLTFSAGVASVAGNARDRQTLLKQADQALYQAKEAGRDRVVLQTVS